MLCNHNFVGCMLLNDSVVTVLFTCGGCFFTKIQFLGFKRKFNRVEKFVPANVQFFLIFH